jgi:hypothetical protein
VNDLCPGCKSGWSAGLRGQDFVIDFDPFRGILRGGQRLGDRDRDRLSDVTHLVARQGKALRLGHRPAVRRRDRPHRPHRTDPVGAHVLAGEEGDNTGKFEGLCGVDGADLRVCMNRSQKDRVQRIRDVDVADITSFTREEAKILDAPQRRPDRIRRIADLGVTGVVVGHAALLNFLAQNVELLEYDLVGNDEKIGIAGDGAMAGPGP